MSEIRFDGRVALVTGAARGLGRQHALLLGERGAAVVVNDVPQAEEAANAVAAAILEAGGRAVLALGSVAVRADAESVIETALHAFGRVDAVVSNAGIIRDRTIAKMSDDDWREVLEVHLFGAFYLTRAAFSVMREQHYGRLVYISSASGLFGNFGQANYGAAKTGLVGLANVAAIEGAKYGIAANVVSPVAATDMTRGSFEQYDGRFDPAYVSPTVVFLASEHCELTGEVLSAGAGQVSRIFIGLSKGIYRDGEPFTPEEIARRMSEIRDLDGFIVPASLDDEMDKFLRLMGRT